MSPQILHINSLEQNLNDIQEQDRTTWCWPIRLRRPGAGGGAAELPIKTSETAFLFLQHFIRKLRAGGGPASSSRNTFLSNTDNASVSLRKLLVESCNLHTVLDCPAAPSRRGRQDVVLFFTKGAPTARPGITSSTPAATWVRPTRSTTTISPTSCRSRNLRRFAAVVVHRRGQHRQEHLRSFSEESEWE